MQMQMLTEVAFQASKEAYFVALRRKAEPVREDVFGEE